MEHLTEVGTGDGLADAEGFRFMVRAAVGAEEDVHDGGDVRIISCIASAIVVPVVKLRSTDDPAQRADG